MTADCKSAAESHGRFDPCPAHITSLSKASSQDGGQLRGAFFGYESGSSSFGRASAFQAEGSEFEPRLPLERERNYRTIFVRIVAHEERDARSRVGIKKN